MIWDIQQMPRAIEDPILAYTAAEGEINQIQWGVTQPDWIGKYRDIYLYKKSSFFGGGRVIRMLGEEMKKKKIR